MATEIRYDQAWVTLATNDSYTLGALVLAQSLRNVNTTRRIAIMITDGVTDAMKEQLTPIFDDVINVNLLDSNDAKNLGLLERPDLGVTFTKLHCWQLVQYTKCVFLDADTLVLVNCDELFDRDEFSAAPDAGWPDCFNSGVFVYAPSNETYKALMEHASRHGSFDGGDQGLLNTFFASWATEDIAKHLPFLYNMVATATYTYIPAYKYYGHNVKIVHFIGTTKPWHVRFDADGQPQAGPHEAHTVEHLQKWWQIFYTHVKPKILELDIFEELGISNQETTYDPPTQQTDPTKSTILSDSASGSEHVDPHAGGEHQQHPEDRGAWELGHPDYMGRHSFDTVLKKINSSLESTKTDP